VEVTLQADGKKLTDNDEERIANWAAQISNDVRGHGVLQENSGRAMRFGKVVVKNVRGDVSDELGHITTYISSKVSVEIHPNLGDVVKITISGDKYHRIVYNTTMGTFAGWSETVRVVMDIEGKYNTDNQSIEFTIWVHKGYISTEAVNRFLESTAVTDGAVEMASSRRAERKARVREFTQRAMAARNAERDAIRKVESAPPRKVEGVGCATTATQKMERLGLAIPEAAGSPATVRGMY
jgi:phosphomevalonate kinase